MATHSAATWGTPLYVPPVPEPQPADLPAWQLLTAFRTNALTSWPRRAYEEWALERSVFGRPSFLLNDPEAIRRVLVDNDANYARTPAAMRVLRPIVGEGVLLSRGDSWKRQRRTLAPAFTPRTLPMLARHVVLATGPALDRLGGMAGVGSGVDMLTFMQALALDIAGRSMFSLEMERFGPALRGMIRRYNERLARPHPSDFFVPLSIPTVWDLLRRRFRREWMGLIESIIAERRRAGTSGRDGARDLLDLMDEARDPETGAGFTPDQLRDQVATLIMAGHETTALALFWACWLLTQAPDVQERVAEEAQGVDITPETALEAVARLPYTRAAVDEALRLYPPAFTIVRLALGPDRAGAVSIPKGSVVMVAPWVLHRHRGLWAESDAFNPDRFLPGAPPPPRFAFLPFGAGPRVCIGAPFALTEAVLVLASLFRRFRLEMPAGARPALPVAVVTTQPDHAPSFRVSPR
ncbi:cytochrome P450 [Azospirillum rugosum]|uniref:Cytochrome P450 n=1 Tax=Azospirillum rugosum TaxID=416170 RepID=A0ABS4SE37_9PROT|nr:cytochrome P450 [Azospirillum rugosum]MBP2290841.1 cytochrome P450 [Azospirillum rugosum]MDQ0529708.1 cytochrome P450 [Azospirillum rugosum]